MSVSRKVMCGVYAAIALLALIGTWGNNVAYVGLSFLELNRTFWGDTFVNAASRSITVDLFFLGLAVLVWMVLEARRLSMRGVWLYLVLGMFIAISVTVPVFLINRERKLAVREPNSPAGTLSTLDVVGLVLVTGAIATYTAYTLRY
jgi:Terpene cyclase DEP1